MTSTAPPPPPAPPPRAPRAKTASVHALAAVVEVHVTPWGMLSVDGAPAVEVVVRRDLKLQPGRHTLRVERPGAGADELVLPLAAGEHRRWTPRLAR